MKNFILLFFLCASAGHCFAQDYIITNSKYQQGQVTRDGKTRIILRLAGIENYQTYSLDTVKEFKVGRVIFEALVVDGSRNFYQRLVTGTLQLYKGQSTYILKDSTQQLVMQKDNFRSVLANRLHCTGSNSDLSKLRWSRRFISKVVQMYNEGNCDTDLLPRKKFGVVAGYNLVKVDMTPQEQRPLSDNTKAYSIGAFVDLPMPTRKPWLYFVVEANYTAFNTSYYSATPTPIFMGLNVKGVNTLASFKLVAPGGSVRPYMKAGLIASFLKLNSPTGLVVTQTDGTDITIDKQQLNDFGSNTQFGMNTAVGVEIHLVKKMNLHIEIRYTKSSPAKIGDLGVKLSNVGLNAAINF